MSALEGCQGLLTEKGKGEKGAKRGKVGDGSVGIY